MHTSERVSSGVEELIEKLRGDGVEAGRAEARRIVDEAKAMAKTIVTEARAEAEKLKLEAIDAAHNEQAAGLAAVRAAARDVLLQLRRDLCTHMATQLKRMLRTELTSPDLLRELVLEMAAKARTHVGADGEVEVVLGTESARALLGEGEGEGNDGGGQPPDAQLDAMMALRLNKEMLRDGLQLSLGTHDTGLVIRPEGGKVTIELTDEALTRALAQRVLPRFRSMLAGIHTTE